MRRVHLRGHPNILKRLLVAVAGCNLGLLLRQLIGVGTPRSLQGRAATVVSPLFRGLGDLWGLSAASFDARQANWGENRPRHRAIIACATTRERGEFHLRLLD